MKGLGDLAGALSGEESSGRGIAHFRFSLAEELGFEATFLGGGGTQ